MKYNLIWHALSINENKNFILGRFDKRRIEVVI